MDEKLLTIKQVAERLQLHPDTIKRMIRSGKLQAAKMGEAKNSHYRISELALTAFLAQSNGRPTQN